MPACRGDEHADMGSYVVLTDRFDLELTTTSEDAAAAYRRGLDLGLAGRRGGIAQLESAIAADPDFAIAAAYLGFLLRTAGEPERGNALILGAVEQAVGATPRERSQVEIARRFAEQSPTEAIEIARQHVEAWPADAMGTFYLQVLFNLFNPDPNRREEWLGITEAMHVAAPRDWVFDGALSFVLEENARYVESRQLAERALEANPDAGSAAHTMAHAFYELGDLEEGRRWLTMFLDRWDGEGGQMLHLVWHRALLDLAAGDDYAVDLDTVVHADAFASLTNGASFLWRLHLSGVDDLPWADVAAPRIPARMTFPTWHLGLVACGRGDRERLAALRSELAPLVGAGRADSECCDQLITALEHYLDGDFGAAAVQLRIAEPQLAAVGGSRAQLEVWEDTLIDALARSGRRDEAEERLRRRLARRDTTRDRAWLGQIAA